MYLSLATADVWEINGKLEPAKLFRSLPSICAPDDILIIGSYWVTEDILRWLVANEIRLTKEQIPFSDTFELNREKYPGGRFYALRPEEFHLEKLASLAKISGGGVEKDLFFDHLLLYRLGNPLIPLVYFHDAFTGGTLYLSGHYSEKTVQSFATRLDATPSLIDNPDLRIER